MAQNFNPKANLLIEHARNDLLNNYVDVINNFFLMSHQPPRQKHS